MKEYIYTDGDGMQALTGINSTGREKSRRRSILRSSNWPQSCEIMEKVNNFELIAVDNC